jgi:hypothetical protein
MDETTSETIGAKVTLSEFYRVNKEARRRNMSVSEFVRDSVFKNVPHCVICNAFATKLIESPYGTRIECCDRCAISEGIARGSHVVQDFLED